MAVSTIDPNGLNVGQFGNRNLILNGSMAVAQRATSVTGVSSTGYHTCDRYRAAFGRSEYVCTVSQDTSAPSGFANSYKIATTTAESSLSAGDQINITQRLEGQDLQRLKKGTADAQPLTVSFWVKSSITATWSFSLYDADNTRHCSKPYTTDVANTWEYKTITFPADTTGAFGNDSGASLFVRFWLDGGTTYTSGTQQSSSWASYTPANDQYAATGFMTTANSTWQITGVQIEVGDTATPFEHISFGDQLQKCRRYFYNLQSAGVYTRFGVGENINASVVQCFIDYPIEMRVKPSLVTSGIPSVYALYHSSSITACTSIALDAYTTTHTGVIAAGVSGTPLLDGGASQLMANNNSSTFLAFDAEL